MPATNNFSDFRKGEDIEIDFTIRVSSVPTSAVVDISGWTFDFKVKRRNSDLGASLITSTISILVAASGTLKIVIAAAQSALLTGDYRYALWRTNSGAEACLSEGFLSVVDTVRETT